MTHSEYGDNRGGQVAEVLSKSLSEWLASHGGGFVTGFTCHVTFVDEDGDRGWATAHASGQSPEVTLGLLRFHTISVEQDIRSYLSD